MDDIGFHGDIILFVDNQIENDLETVEITLHAAFENPKP